MGCALQLPGLLPRSTCRPQVPSTLLRGPMTSLRSWKTSRRKRWGFNVWYSKKGLSQVPNPGLYPGGPRNTEAFLGSPAESSQGLPAPLNASSPPFTKGAQKCHLPPGSSSRCPCSWSPVVTPLPLDRGCLSSPHLLTGRPFLWSGDLFHL